MTDVSLKLIEGLPFEYIVTVTDEQGEPIDLVGSTIVMKLRQSLHSPEVVAELSDTNGRITLTGVAGQFKLYLEPAVTATLQGRYVFDILLITSDNSYYLIAEGSNIITNTFVSR